MKMTKEILIVLRRVTLDDLKKILENSLYDNNPCHYKHLEGGFEYYKNSVIQDIEFYSSFRYDTPDGITEEELDSFVVIFEEGLKQMFLKTIQDYYDRFECF